MRIKYNILWVDDRKDEFEQLSYDKRIIDYAHSLFFEPHLDFCETIDEAKEMISKKHFDVIFSDYNIDDSMEEEQGDSFISYIRSRNVNTEVLFYSAMEELPTIRLNRVVFFSLAGLQGGYRILLEQMENLIELTTEKLHDLTALRGLVMAETSELDKIMEDISYYYFVQNKSEESDLLFDEILKNVEEDYRQNLQRSAGCDKKCTHKIRKKPVEKIIISLAFDSARKARTLNKIIERKGISIKEYGIETSFYDAYLEDIIRTRNLLAHSQSRINDGGTEILVSKIDGNELSFDDEKIKGIRQRILLYEKLLDNLYHTLTSI